MWKWGLRSASLLLLALASAPSYAQKVSYDWDKDVDFSPYKTYKWAEITGGKSSSPTTHERIINDINVQLQAKGLKLKPKSDADLYVVYQVITGKNGQPASFNPDGAWRPGLGLNGSKPTAGAMTQGALVVDVYDYKLKKLIWRGTVSGATDNRQAVNYYIDKGLGKLFTYFPPPPPS